MATMEQRAIGADRRCCGCRPPSTEPPEGTASLQSLCSPSVSVRPFSVPVLKPDEALPEGSAQASLDGVNVK